MALLDWIKKARRTLDTRVGDDGGATVAVTAGVSADVESAYDNHGEVARGGMGAIMRVSDRVLLRTAAMKVLEPSDGITDDTKRAIFLEEAQITSQLDHPNICPIYDYGKDSAGTDYITMKLVKGQTLADLIHAPGYDPSDLRCLREALDVFLKVCDALAFAHSKGVLHRDLKPENIMVGDYGQVYLMDWGVAKVMSLEAHGSVRVSRTGMSATDQPGAIVGTLMYMAPEQARGESGTLDVRSDVFGLGAILYEILTQIPPYYAQSLGDLVLMAQGAAWRPPQEVCGDDLPLPAALCVVCERALQARREDRYQDALSLKAAVEEFLVGGLSFPTQAFQVGDCIVNEGEVGDTAFIIQRGYCRVFKYIGGEMRPLADLGPGDVFGEAAVFADTPRMATIQAISDVQVQVVSKEVFTKDLGVASSMGAFVRALATRFVTTDRELRGAQDQVRALTAAMAAMTPAAPLTTAEAPPPPPTPEMSMAAMAMMPLPPLPHAAPTTTTTPAPVAMATPAAPVATTPPEAGAPTATPAVPGPPVPSLWTAPASEPPPALVAAMARLYGMKLPAEEAARMIVAAATEAALRLRP